MRCRLASLCVLSAALTVLGFLPNDAAGMEYDTILRIATQAHEEIRIQLSGPGSAPTYVERLFEDGTGELDALREAARNEDPDASKAHFLTAMDVFKRISHMISDAPPAEATASGGSVIPDLRSALERLEKYSISLENIARTHDTHVDFSQLGRLFGLAEQQISGGDHDAAQESIEQIDMLIADISSKLRDAAQEKASDRAQRFARQYLDMLDEMISRAEELGRPGDVIDELKGSRERLAASSDSGQIIDEIKEIMSLKERLDLSQSDMLISRADQMEAELDELLAAGVNAAGIENARKLVSELRSSADDGNHEAAWLLLRALTDVLGDLHDSAA